MVRRPICGEKMHSTKNSPNFPCPLTRSSIILYCWFNIDIKLINHPSQTSKWIAARPNAFASRHSSASAPRILSRLIILFLIRKVFSHELGAAHQLFVSLFSSILLSLKATLYRSILNPQPYYEPYYGFFKLDAFPAGVYFQANKASFTPIQS